MSGTSDREPSGETETLARYGAFTVERTRIPHSPPAKDTVLTRLVLWTTAPDQSSQRILIQHGLINDSWSLEFVTRNVIIWLRTWERQQAIYSLGQVAELPEEWRYSVVESALRDLMKLFPSLALEDFSYLTECSDPYPNAWNKLSRQTRGRRAWWEWDSGGYYVWEGGKLVERVLGDRVTQVGAFDVHALRLRWLDGREEPAPWYEFVLRTKMGPIRLLCTSWWSGAPGTDSQEPAKVVEDIEIWRGSMCRDIANGLEFAARFADEESRRRILEGVARRQAQYDAVLPASKEARAAYPGPQIIYQDEPDLRHEN